MDNTNRPMTALAVEAYLRSLMPPAVVEQTDSPYPFLFGMATVKLAEANREISRLRDQLETANMHQPMPTHDLTAVEYNCWNCGELARRDHPHVCEVSR